MNININLSKIAKELGRVAKVLEEAQSETGELRIKLTSDQVGI